MDDSELAAAHDANFLATISLLADVVDGGFRESFGSVHVAATRLGFAFFNAIFVTEPSAGLEDLSQAVELMRTERLPFVVHVRNDLPQAADAKRSLGLVGDGLLPCFGMEPRRAPQPPKELSIARVDHASFEPFMAALVVGFEMPRAMAENLFLIRILDDPGLRGYLGSVDGRPVATAMSMRTGQTLGVYSVATLPDARGRGYGTALTWATLADADPGVEAVVLQASELGRPVYERMGFRLVREFLELGPA
jgi:ribosomal protein S18 acetylase RimI-like enzyme